MSSGAGVLAHGAIQLDRSESLRWTCYRNANGSLRWCLYVEVEDEDWTRKVWGDNLAAALRKAGYLSVDWPPSAAA